MSSIKLVTLGGVRENGKNLYVAEVNDSIFVLDAGLKYPENEQLGVDVVIPNMDYLFENKDRIAGVFLTHGHADAIGALPYLLAEAKVPVFGTELTIELAKLFVKSNDSVKKFNDFHVIDQNSEIDFGDAVVSFFQTTHSIPESIGIVIGTPEGNIVYTGDFKFDQTASESYATDFARLAEIGREGVLALLSDSANADSNIQVASEQEVGDAILDTIADWDGRVIVAAVASNLSRIQQVFDAAAETGRRVVLTGFDVENIVRTAIRLNKLSLANEKLLIKPKEMSRFEDHELIILETGRMGEPINGLRKMSIGRHRYVEIKDGDLVYIVTTPSIAKEAVVARVENMVYQAGGIVKLITSSLRVSGHGNARDLQLMINLLRPKYLFPIQGEYRELDAHARVAMEVGILPENIFIPKPRVCTRALEIIFFSLRFTVIATIKIPSSDKTLRSRRTILPTSPMAFPSIMTSPAETLPAGTKSPFSYSITVPRFGIKIFSGKIPTSIATRAWASNFAVFPLDREEIFRTKKVDHQLQVPCVSVPRHAQA